MVVISLNCAAVIRGTRKVRLGVSSSACSATRRCIASRTGITLTPSASAALRNEICSPGIICPLITRSRNWS
ncbi:hypothetical protein D9M68_665980 [compost metagenome]